MLVLTRKKNESIVINDNIRIQILQIKGKQIRVGIEAPATMKVLRSELPVIVESQTEEGGRETRSPSTAAPVPSPELVILPERLSA